MNKNQYRKLGDYIAPAMEKNVGLKIHLSQGICNNKYFQTPRQVAQDSENDQIVRRGQFAFNKATTRNGEKISIAYRDGEDCTVSSAYQVFYIKDEEQLNPYYLMMWFKRPEFDRYARFKSHGSAHEFFTYEEMCNVLLPVPSIEEQRRIVSEYQTVEQRIQNNEQLIKKLEETAQAIYNHTFVEGIDEENLPEGWRKGKLGEVADIKGGKRLPKGEELQINKSSHPYIKVADMCNHKYVILNSEIQYVSDDVQKQIHQYIVSTDDVILSIVGTIGNVNVIDESLNGANLTENCVKFINLRNISNNYLYSFLVSKEGKSIIEQNIVGGVQGKLPIYNIEKIELLIPSVEAVKNFNFKIGIIDTELKTRLKENNKLKELQSLLLAKMGQ